MGAEDSAGWGKRSGLEDLAGGPRFWSEESASQPAADGRRADACDARGRALRGDCDFLGGRDGFTRVGCSRRPDGRRHKLDLPRVSGPKASRPGG